MREYQRRLELKLDMKSIHRMKLAMNRTEKAVANFKLATKKFRAGLAAMAESTQQLSVEIDGLSRVDQRINRQRALFLKRSRRAFKKIRERQV